MYRTSICSAGLATQQLAPTHKEMFFCRFFNIFLCGTILAIPASVFASPVVTSPSSSSPNIVIILIDDVGWNDLSYNTPNLSQISTPNIDKLSNRGIKLKNHYVQTTCTPTVSPTSLEKISFFFQESKSPDWPVCCQYWSHLCNGARLSCWITHRYSNDATVTSSSWL
jgi:hypothetical protein